MLLAESPLELTILTQVVQLGGILAAAIWAVASIRAKTAELGQQISSLGRSIDKLDRAVERLDLGVRDLDHRVTRLEVSNHDTPPPRRRPGAPE